MLKWIDRFVVRCIPRVGSLKGVLFYCATWREAGGPRPGRGESCHLASAAGHKPPEPRPRDCLHGPHSFSCIVTFIEENYPALTGGWSGRPDGQL
eukprot:2508368-Pyramimonas_sp.AAC.1